MKTEKTDSMFCVFSYGSEIYYDLLSCGKKAYMEDENGVKSEVVIRQIEPISFDPRGVNYTQFLCEYAWKEEK